MLRFAVNYSHYVNASIVPGNDPPAPWIVNPVTGAMSAALVWKVDIQYAFSYGPAFVPAPLTLSPSSPVASDLHQQMVAALTGNANPVPAIAMTGDILTPELNFYHYLGQSTPGSSTRDLALIPGTVYGVPHPVPGDVDNSGCTDQADLSQLLQSDTWMHQAVLPNHHAIQADVNADGWVNQFDVNIVLANWGAGCTVLPQPPKGGYVTIPYVPTTLAATPSASQVSLTWKASSGYQLQRASQHDRRLGLRNARLRRHGDELHGYDRHRRHDVLLRGQATDSQGTSAASAQVSATSPPTAASLRESGHLDERPSGLVQYDRCGVRPHRGDNSRLGVRELRWQNRSGGRRTGHLRGDAAACALVGWLHVFLGERRDPKLRQHLLVVREGSCVTG